MFRPGSNTLVTAMLALLLTSALCTGNSVAAEGAVIAAPAPGVSATWITAAAVASTANGAAAAADAKAAADKAAKKESAGPVAWTLAYLAENPFAFLFLALALGYPLGRVALGGISLGSTAGTLVVSVGIALLGSAVYGLTFNIPGLVEDIFLMMFMYALGMRVGPQFFSGLARGGLDFVVIGVIVCLSNVAIIFFGAKAVGLEPGYAAGIISGSYTVTAVMGVAGSAVSSGAFKLPDGMSADAVMANMAAGYAISYILSSVTIILLIKYLPSMFGVDPVQAAREAEASFSGDADPDAGALPGTAGAGLLGFSGRQIRSYRVEHEELVGKTVQDLFHERPRAAVLRVVRGDEVIEASDNPTLQMGDVIGVAGRYGDLVAKASGIVGTEVDEPRARRFDIEVADVYVGKSEHAGMTLEDLGKQVGFGVYLKGLFRGGTAIPHLPKTVVEKGDVLRIAGPDWCVKQAAKAMNSTPIIESTYTEVAFLSAALVLGFVVGHASVVIGGIPFALGTSAGCMLMGILISYFRTRKPTFGGPTSEGARSFLNDIGLSLFVAVLGATVGPKILSSFKGDVVIWIAVFGLAGALIPPFLAWLYGYYIRKMNPIVLAGACAGGRNSTPSLNGVQEISGSAIAAVAFPVPYALTSALVLILGYMAMVFS